ncbi:MAG: hypothetical protein IPJ19_19270 [Planctomycetes bacterium]|nr:hypothetical protein [Planctomycetota bacterium]
MNQVRGESASKVRGKRWRTRLLALACSLALALVGAEAGLRLLLYHDVPGLGGLARKLRTPAYYADVYRESLFWKLAHLWSPPEERLPFPHASKVTGWTGWRIDPVEFTTPEEPRIGERRPVLLYGDSFAECVTAPGQAFQGLLEDTPEGNSNAIVNFGTAGFGPGQALLMLERTLDRYAERKPLVVFSIFLDEDPERALLDFRGAPKPTFTLENGELVLHPLEQIDPDRWLEEHPPGVPSYLWRLVRRRAKFLPDSTRRTLAGLPTDVQVIRLTRALLARAHALLESRGIEHCVLGFHGLLLLEAYEPNRWREHFVEQACRQLGMHFVSSRPYLVAAVDGQLGRARESLFVTSGPLAGHYNARGNRATLEALLQAIHGNWETPDTSGVQAGLRSIGLDPRDAQTFELDSLGRPARLLFHGDGPGRCQREVAGKDGLGTRLIGLHPEFEKSTRLEWRLAASAHFSSDLIAVRSKVEDELPEAVRLRFLAGGEVLRSFDLRPGDPLQHIELDIPGPCAFVLEVLPVEGYSRSAWARLDQPVLR